MATLVVANFHSVDIDRAGVVDGPEVEQQIFPLPFVEELERARVPDDNDFDPWGKNRFVWVCEAVLPFMRDGGKTLRGLQRSVGGNLESVWPPRPYAPNPRVLWRLHRRQWHRRHWPVRGRWQLRD